MRRGERTLEARFSVREERFAQGDLCLEILLPLSSESLIDEAEFEGDERLPYWAELWPAARALAAHLLETPTPPEPVIELGAGLGLPSLVLRSRGVEVLATDYYAEALEFAEHNAARNGLGPLPTRLIDWREPPPDLGRFGTVVAADILYEERSIEPLVRLLPGLVTPGGSLILADPGRIHLYTFRSRLEAEGWRCEDLGIRMEASPAPGDYQLHITLLRFHPPRPAR
jgi:predicted nicotinamide N-methyase